MLRRRGYRVIGPGPPAPGRGGPPPILTLPRPPGLPGNVQLPSLPDPLAGVGAALKTASGDIVAAGSVLLGVILIVAGLLLATGQGGKVARAAGQAGLAAATRGG